MATRAEMGLAIRMIGTLMSAARGPAKALGALPYHMLRDSAKEGSADALMAEVCEKAKAFSDAIEKAYAWEPKEATLADVQAAISRIGAQQS